MKRAWDYWAALSPDTTKRATRIALQLVGMLARFAPSGADAFELEPDTPVGALVASLGIREDQVMLAFVNGKKATLETRIPDRATVTLCPYICGE